MKTDLEIQKDVMAELQWEPALGSTEIGVSVKNGVVILSGVTDSYYKKVLAEKAAKRVNGVNAVAEEIIVRLPGRSPRRAVALAQAVVNALAWDSTVDEKNVKVVVENGVVTLEGEVEWHFQRESASKAIHRLVGITRIINNLRVKTRINVKDIEHNIVKAFHRSATVDSRAVKIEVLGDKVILKGTVRSFAERSDAEKMAWSSPGVMSVDNKLVIDSGVMVY